MSETRSACASCPPTTSFSAIRWVARSVARGTRAGDPSPPPERARSAAIQERQACSQSDPVCACPNRREAEAVIAPTTVQVDRVQPARSEEWSPSGGYGCLSCGGVDDLSNQRMPADSTKGRLVWWLLAGGEANARRAKADAGVNMSPTRRKPLTKDRFRHPVRGFLTREPSALRGLHR